MLLREADKKRSAVMPGNISAGDEYHVVNAIKGLMHGHLSQIVNSHDNTKQLPIATQLLLMTEIGA